MFTTDPFASAEASYRQDRVRAEFAGRTVRRLGRRVRTPGQAGSLHRSSTSA